MPEKSPENNQRRIPAEYSGIEVNFCKTPGCPNFGIPPSREKQPVGRPTEAVRAKRDWYRLQGTTGSNGNVPGLLCQHCNTVTTLKSNQGVHEELIRIASFLAAGRLPGCATPNCANHGKSLSVHPDLYRPHGKTRSDSKRFRCRACGSTFSVGKATRRQRVPHKNHLVFGLLVNHQPLSRICEVADISFPTLYRKIDFLHRQCLAFVADRERRFSATEFERLYLCSDRQDYIVNWGDRSQRKTIRLTAIGTADLRSQYVFAMTPNFDPRLDPADVEREAAENGDRDAPPPFRRHARLWLRRDYQQSVERSKGKGAAAIAARTASLQDEIRRREALVAARDDLDAPEVVTDDQALPTRGMQVHADYTMLGHFTYLRRLLGRTKKVRFFLDQDAGMRQACLAAFHDAVRDRWADAFFVATVKDWTIDQKREAVAQAKVRLRAALAARPGQSVTRVKVGVIRDRIAAVRDASALEKGRLNGVWIEHPFPDMAEPEKRVSYLTDFDDYDAEHLARLYNLASLRAIDTFFMQLRRRVKAFERGIPTARRARRIWVGYAPYDPAMVGKLLDIFRVWRNWVFVGKDGRTAAERLGVARGKIRIEDIIYFVPGA